MYSILNFLLLSSFLYISLALKTSDYECPNVVFSSISIPENSFLSTLRFDKFIVFSSTNVPENSDELPFTLQFFSVIPNEDRRENKNKFRFDKFIVE